MASPITAIILAAGFSTRFGPQNKLLAPLNAKPVLTHVIANVAPLKLAETLVVTNTSSGPLNDLCLTKGLRVVVNENARAGMGHSLAAGVRAATQTHAIMVILGDMPFIKQRTFAALINAYDTHGHENSIIFPAQGAKRGHPVIFGNAYVPALAALTGDTGAQSLIAGHAKHWRSIDVEDQGIFRDVDHLEDLLTSDIS